MKIDRARMFAEGQHEKLLKVLSGEERRLDEAYVVPSSAYTLLGSFRIGCTSIGSFASRLRSTGARDQSYGRHRPWNFLDLQANIFRVFLGLPKTRCLYPHQLAVLVRGQQIFAGGSYMYGTYTTSGYHKIWKIPRDPPKMTQTMIPHGDLGLRTTDQPRYRIASGMVLSTTILVPPQLRTFLSPFRILRKRRQSPTASLSWSPSVSVS